jgi:DNA-binding NarL/FixJ family response regulator
MILDAQADIEIAGEAQDGRAALEFWARAHPDVVLMDIRMPTLDGLAATRLLLAEGKRAPRVLILTTFDLDECVYEALPPRRPRCSP